jgi:hypothetical protein
VKFEFEEHAEDILMLAIIFGGFGILFLSDLIFPPAYAKQLGGMLFIFIVFAGTMGIDLYAREVANPYPYIEMIVRPYNKKLHLFIEQDLSYGRLIDKESDFHEIHLKLAFPVKYLDYGKIREVVIHHQGKWSERVRFRPGTAVWRGLRISHPMTEVIEVVQIERATTSVDHGQPIPIFFLRSASKDIDYYKTMTYSMPFISKRTSKNNNFSSLSLSIKNPNLEVESYKSRIADLEAQLIALRSERDKWKEVALSYEEILEQKSAEIKGLLDAKSGFRETIVEALLTFWEAAGSIDKAIKMIRGGRSFRFDKWVALTILGLAGIAYFYVNPEAGTTFYRWLSVPLNALIFAMIVISIVGVIIYTEKRKR